MGSVVKMKSAVIATLSAVALADIYSFCDSTELVANAKVTFTPNVPESGKALTVRVEADYLGNGVSAGSNIDLNLKAGPVSVKKNVDLCDAVKDFMPCPIAPGHIDTTVKIDVPKIPFPFKNINGHIRLKDHTGLQFLCVRVDFKLRGVPEHDAFEVSEAFADEVQERI
eukprot:GDKJ01028933.1.p2 GENE.GDKJ01028933.1~~GDKJ01028933.1.p2  ORF type:complete len:169 (+),score=58.10 GDKJ01028933.1:1-507(+)